MASIPISVIHSEFWEDDREIRMEDGKFWGQASLGRLRSDRMSD